MIHSDLSIFDLIKVGGWVMTPLIVLSVVAWIVCLERFIAFRNWKEKNESFLLNFQNLCLKKDIPALEGLCEKSESDLAGLAKLTLPILKNGKIEDRQLTKIDRFRSEQLSKMRKSIWILGTIGSATPFIGLFGTVVGIIKAFTSMAQSGAGGFNVVAAGISEALVATAAGILVAVIAVFFFNFFQVRIAEFQFQYRQMSEELMESIESAL